MSKIKIEKLVKVDKDYYLKNNYGLYEPITKEEIVAARGHSALTMVKKLKELDGELATEQKAPAAQEPPKVELNLNEITESGLGFMSVPKIQEVADALSVKYAKSWNKARLYLVTSAALREYQKRLKIHAIAQKAGGIPVNSTEPTTANQEGFAYIPPANGIEPVQTMETGALRSEENED